MTEYSVLHELTIPDGAVGAVMYSWLTGGELQQFIPLFLPFLFCVHQTRLRRETFRGTDTQKLDVEILPNLHWCTFYKCHKLHAEMMGQTDLRGVLKCEHTSRVFTPVSTSQ